MTPPSIPAAVLELVLFLFETITKLIQSGNDGAAQEEALMATAERVAEELEKRKFG